MLYSHFQRDRRAIDLSLIDQILEHNERFVAEKKYEDFYTNKYPDKKLAIVTCMDTRLTLLLPQAMNLRNGDAKIIKTAGAIVHQPFGSVMRSILVAVYATGAEEVCVIGHDDCGFIGLNPEEVLSKAMERGISKDTIATINHSGINLNRFLSGYDTVEGGVLNSVRLIRNHPLMPKQIPVHGMIINSTTGKLDWIHNGYDA